MIPSVESCFLSANLLHSSTSDLGDVAKWLGTALQKRLRRFKSGRHLQMSNDESSKSHVSCENQKQMDSIT